MSDTKVTGFRAQAFESVEMTHQTLNYRDIGEKRDTYISCSYPLYKKDDAGVRHLNTIRQLDRFSHHSDVTGASRDVLSMRWMKQREKKSRRASGQISRKNISHSHRRNTR